MIPFIAALFLAGSFQPAIDRAVPSAQVQYLVLDVQSREVIAARWPDAATPIPLGSLVKPFTALAARNAPEYECKGEAGGCWLKKGHGKLGLREALAQSCNAYFLQLARTVEPEDLKLVAAKYSIAPPSLETPETRIGLGTGWKISPLAITRAYAELARREGEPAVRLILHGLEDSARFGTSQAIGGGTLAKTGTAPPSDKHHNGDGFTLILDPADSPRIAMLIRVQNVPGAEAAKTAARILSIVRSGK